MAGEVYLLAGGEFLEVEEAGDENQPVVWVGDGVLVAMRKKVVPPTEVRQSRLGELGK